MSGDARRGSRKAGGRTTRSIWLDRLLLGAHAAIALLAVCIVADTCAGGRLVPWPPGGPLGPALIALALAFLIANLPWRRRPPRGREPGPDDGIDETSTNRRGRSWRSRRRSGTGS